MMKYLVVLALIGLATGQQRSIGGRGRIQQEIAADFVCPEEFGYYPHPTDCTRYYVCVFGGALLEKCTGSLVYSQELQTCDWARNVDCLGKGTNSTSGSSSSSSSSSSSVSSQSGPARRPLDSEPQLSIKNQVVASSNRVPPSEPVETKRAPIQQPQRVSLPLELLDEDFSLQDSDPSRQGRLFKVNPRGPSPSVAQESNNIKTNVLPEPRRIVPASVKQQTVVSNEDFVKPTTFRPAVPVTVLKSEPLTYDDDYYYYDDETDGHSTTTTTTRRPQNVTFSRRQDGWRPLPQSYSSSVPSMQFSSKPKMQEPQTNLPRGPVPLPVTPSTRSLGSGWHKSLASQPDDSLTSTRDTNPPAWVPFNQLRGAAEKNPATRIGQTEVSSNQPRGPVPLPLTSSLQGSDLPKKGGVPANFLREIEALVSASSTQPRGPDTAPAPLPKPSSNFAKNTGAPSTYPRETGALGPFPPTQPRGPLPSPASTSRGFVSPTGVKAPSAFHRETDTSGGVLFTQARGPVPSPVTSSFEHSSSFKQTKVPSSLPRESEAGAAVSFTQSRGPVPIRLTSSFQGPHPVSHSTGTNKGKTEGPVPLPVAPSTLSFSRLNLPDTFTDPKTLKSAPKPVTQTKEPEYDAYEYDYYEDDHDADQPDQQQRLSTTTQPTTTTPALRTTTQSRPLPSFNRQSSFQAPKKPSHGQFLIETTKPVPAKPTLSNADAFDEFPLYETDVQYPDGALDYEEEDVFSSTTTSTTTAPTTRRTTTTTATTTTTTTTTTTRPPTTTTTTTTTTARPTTTQRARLPIDSSSDGSRGGTKSRGPTQTTAEEDSENTTQPKRTRPTLKPVSALVPSKIEPVDIFKHPPKRLDPIFPQPAADEPAAKCNPDICRLPDCSCGGKNIPGGLSPRDTPQLVLLTFDDAVNDLNKELYSDLFESGLTNPNGCPISATFYVSHEWTDYSQVQNLYADGHEIASHTVSHSFGEQFSAKKWAREAAGQRDILAAYGGVKAEDIRGLRAPFLSVGGNRMFKMLYDMNFTYDSSMPVYENKPPSWPYTLDYKIFHDCMIPPCPTKSYPGVWEVPMVMWQDLNGGRCSMGDGCANPPDAEGVYKMLIKNFERHYTSNRAPFPLYYHASWFTTPHHKEGFEAFLDTIVSMDDVWLVTNWQAIQWVRDPTSLDNIKNFKPFGCDYPDRPKRCNSPKVCNAWHKEGVRYMRTCQPCPEIYPWTGKTGVRNIFLDQYGDNEA